MIKLFFVEKTMRHKFLFKVENFIYILKQVWMRSLNYYPNCLCKRSSQFPGSVLTYCVMP